jgi:hypothetical protein
MTEPNTPDNAPHAEDEDTAPNATLDFEELPDNI